MRTFIILDTHALVYRFFYALPPLTTPPPAREPIGALYGLAGILLSLVAAERPDYLAAALDRPEPTFRKKDFAGYKGHRAPAPSELVSQLAKIPEFFACTGVRTCSVPGFEADDVIGTLAERFSSEPELSTTVLSGDLDTLQLVSGSRVLARIFRTGLSTTDLYDEAAVTRRYGLPPAALPDYKALVGDQSDNIPGVPGIGPKTARALIQEFHTLEGIYENIGLVPAKTAEKLEAQKAQAFLSRKLATIVRDAPLPIRSLEELKTPADGVSRLRNCYAKLGFESLVRRLRV